LTAGLAPRAALALARAGFLSLSDLEGRSVSQLLAIPGVGRFSVEILGELLGWPRPSESRSFPEGLWRQRGIPPEAAVTFVQVGMTMARLRSITREELLTLFRVGPATVRACELLLGKPIPSRRPADPVAAFWRDRGIPAKAAKSLSQAGIASPEDLAGCSREDLLSLPRVGNSALRRLEKILGTRIPSRIADWQRRGLSLYVTHALLRAGLRTLEDLDSLTRDQFLALPGLGLYALDQCEKLLGRKLPSRQGHTHVQGG
jgi:hypothetical protein